MARRHPDIRPEGWPNVGGTPQSRRGASAPFGVVRPAFFGGGVDTPEAGLERFKICRSRSATDGKGGRASSRAWRKDPSARPESNPPGLKLAGTLALPASVAIHKILQILVGNGLSAFGKRPRLYLNARESVGRVRLRSGAGILPASPGILPVIVLRAGCPRRQAGRLPHYFTSKSF